MQLHLSRLSRLITLVFLIAAISACKTTPAEQSPTVELPSNQSATLAPEASASVPPVPDPTEPAHPVPTQTRLPTEAIAVLNTATASPTTRPTPEEDDWAELPVIPMVSQRAIEIYQLGISLGRNPHAFSKIGDCQNVSSYFLSPFAYSSAYRLGPNENLQATIDWYQETESFTRESLAVKGGFNVAAVLSPLRADSEICHSGESPLACELRLHNPSVAIISMETWWSGQPDAYEKYMRQLLDYTISQGVVPILATKADNLEGENQINKVLARLAWEYDIPLWNFWASVQALPNKGLTEDGFHLTLGDYFYDDPTGTATGWSMRNLTALQALDAVRLGVAP
jgi:hypothetical protein